MKRTVVMGGIAGIIFAFVVVLSSSLYVAATAATESDVLPNQSDVSDEEPDGTNTASDEIVVTPQPPELPNSPLIVTSYRYSGAMLDFIQIYNNSSDLIDLQGWSVEYVVANDSEEVNVPIALNGWALPHSYFVVSRSGIVAASDSEYNAPMIHEGFNFTGLSLNSDGKYVPYPDAKLLFNDTQRVALTKSSAGNYTLTSHYENVQADEPLYGGGLYTYPEAPPIKVVEILASPKDCSPLSVTTECQPYVKLYNVANEAIDLSSYRLRLGYGNESVSITNTVELNEEVSPQSYVTISIRNDGKPLSIPASGNVWLEDTYGLHTYDTTVQPYEDIGGTAHEGTSWALASDGTWKWATPSPGEANKFAPRISQENIASDESSSLVPCRDDQERNPATNRCRLIASATTSLVPCKAGQYRSSETNRCRSVASVATTLTPCTASQYRSPETNRCRNIASAASTKLVPCKQNQERNPETNRCRNVTTDSIPTAAFPVTPIAETGTAFVGWWALGGVSVAGVGYGIWEWRREVISGIQRIGQFFTSSK